MTTNPSALIDYATSRAMKWSWRYRRNGALWEAEVCLAHADGGGCPSYIGRGETAQAALDQAIDRCLSYWKSLQTTHEGINHSGPLA